MQPKDGEKYPFLTRKMLAFEQGTTFGLNITSRSNLGAVIAIRGLTKEGPFNLEILYNSAGAVQTNNLRIPDIPIMISVVDKDGTLLQGMCFVELSLTINNTKSYALCSGWIYKNKSISYPQTESMDTIPGRGFFSLYQTTANPAAGANWDETLGQGIQYRILGFRAKLTTGADVANRRVMFYTTNGGLEQNDMFSLVDQPANTAYTYYASIQPAQTQVLGNRIIMSVPNELWLKGGHHFKSLVANLYPGDQWSDLEFLMEEFLT